MSSRASGYSSNAWFERPDTDRPSLAKVCVASGYLADAKDHLGDMFDYAVNTVGMDIRDIFERFANSGVGEMFEIGHPLFLAGMCGSDLARRVL